MPNTVNIEQLTRAAKTYNNVLRELPFFQLNELAKALRLKILKVSGEDILVSTRRKAGILRPYTPGLTLGNEEELVKFYESKLKPEITYAEIVDNITNYRDKKVISNQGEMVNNKTKKHPLELFILTSIVRSYGEDVIFTAFFAERDKDVLSPMTAYNGFYTKLDILIAAGEVAETKRNRRLTGKFDVGSTPGIGTDGKNHFDRLVEWCKSGNPLLRRGESLLYTAENPLVQAREGLRAKMKYFDMPSTEQMLERLRSDANVPNLKVAHHEALGTGDRLMLAKPGLFDFGVGDESDSNYVQVRNPYSDPNMVQFWMQSAYDTRINDVHEKVFLTNEQTNVAANLAGDYAEQQ